MMPCKLCARLRCERHFNFIVVGQGGIGRLSQRLSWLQSLKISPANMPFCFDCGIADRDDGQGYWRDERVYKLRTGYDCFWMWCSHCKTWEEVKKDGNPLREGQCSLHDRRLLIEGVFQTKLNVRYRKNEGRVRVSMSM
jgi:hypothetical protein